MLSPQLEFTLPFIKKEQLTDNVYSFYFDRSQNKEFNFEAGQYMRVLLDFTEPDPRGRSRLLSISSSSDEKDVLMFTLKVEKEHSLFKKYLMSLEEGKEVNFWGPIGNFVLPEEPKPLIFISLGIGITPFRSLLLSANEYAAPITLLAFFRTKEGEIFYEELQRIEKENNRSINFLTTAVNGRLTEKLIKQYVKKLDEPLYYISGPVEGVQAVSDILKEMGIVKEQIKKEQFTGY